nr:hypothetical protein [Angustibacter aerolatus]
MQRHASVDDLTGLLNRRAGLARVQEPARRGALGRRQRAARRRPRPLQGGERPVRPPGRRRRAAGDRHRVPHRDPAGRRRLPVRR